VPKKTYTAEELENKRLKKNRVLREWRASHKEHVKTYIKNWYAKRAAEDAVKEAAKAS
jgi:ribosomal protein S20